MRLLGYGEPGKVHHSELADFWESRGVEVLEERLAVVGVCSALEEAADSQAACCSDGGPLDRAELLREPSRVTDAPGSRISLQTVGAASEAFRGLFCSAHGWHSVRSDPAI